MARLSAGTKFSRGSASIASSILESVTSLVRTWPSTIFWRAVEKPDICGTCEIERTCRGRNENHAIFGTRFCKTQHGGSCRSGGFHCANYWSTVRASRPASSSTDGSAGERRAELKYPGKGLPILRFPPYERSHANS